MGGKTADSEKHNVLKNRGWKVFQIVVARSQQEESEAQLKRTSMMRGSVATSIRTIL